MGPEGTATIISDSHSKNVKTGMANNFLECLSSKSMAMAQIKACEAVATRVRITGMVIE